MDGRNGPSDGVVRAGGRPLVYNALAFHPLKPPPSQPLVRRSRPSRSSTEAAFAPPPNGAAAASAPADAKLFFEDGRARWVRMPEVADLHFGGDESAAMSMAKRRPDRFAGNCQLSVGDYNGACYFLHPKDRPTWEWMPPPTNMEDECKLIAQVRYLRKNLVRAVATMPSARERRESCCSHYS